ncbi:MAG: adenylate kinase [Clostridiales bacterium]|nr:adenylate kinase [Clostridiales bacterium]
MQKVIVIGSPGSGKSTFARKLRDITSLPLYYLDLLWHKPDKTNITREEFDTRLLELLKKDKWIIDGNYQRTLEIRLRACETVFLMDYPLEICLQGAESRVGVRHEDMPWIETELDAEFKQWIINFPKDKLPNIYQLINMYKKDKKIVVFKSREEAEDYLQSMSNK